MTERKRESPQQTARDPCQRIRKQAYEHLIFFLRARGLCQRIRKQAYEHLILRGRFFLRNGP